MRAYITMFESNFFIAALQALQHSLCKIEIYDLSNFLSIYLPLFSKETEAETIFLENVHSIASYFNSFHLIAIFVYIFMCK